MRYELRFARHAVNDLRGLDKEVSRRILKKLKEFTESGKPFSFAKPLTGPLAGLYRFRIGDYRVIFETDHKGTLTLLNVLKVKHRRDVYG